MDKVLDEVAGLVKPDDRVATCAHVSHRIASSCRRLIRVEVTTKRLLAAY